MNKQEIKAYYYYHDGGDGGGGISVYPSLEALKKGEWPSEPDEDGDADYTPEEAEEAFQHAFDGDSPYDYGEISDVTIKFNIDENGNVSLAEDFYMHYGQ